jgi:1-acyl-sn-glycerol-3-phosphate acyltransferase
MNHLNHAWRLFATGLGFLVFGLGGLIMSLFLFPGMFVLIRDTSVRQTAARSLIGRAFSAFIWMMKTMGVLSYQIKGTEHADFSHNQLIIANHPTLIDVVFLVSLFPQTDCVIKESVTRNPFMRGTVAAANYISNNKTRELLNSCIRRLKSGKRLLLFPEGTRSIKGKQPLELKLGAAFVAVKSGAEILPIVIRCTPPMLAKHEPWYKIPPSKPFFSIQILTPTSVAKLVPGDHDPRQTKRALNNAFVKLFAQELS